MAGHPCVFFCIKNYQGVLMGMGMSRNGGIAPNDFEEEHDTLIIAQFWGY